MGIHIKNTITIHQLIKNSKKQQKKTVKPNEKRRKTQNKNHLNRNRKTI